mmetsp:Transcript_7783/g.14833  ORF Transcript_7783/g.14833 Transcript_7783/m.14833 type:complete len:603 (-) Transcript_7783:90-1898(-)
MSYVLTTSLVLLPFLHRKGNDELSAILTFFFQVGFFPSSTDLEVLRIHTYAADMPSVVLLLPIVLSRVLHLFIATLWPYHRLAERRRQIRTNMAQKVHELVERERQATEPLLRWQRANFSKITNTQRAEVDRLIKEAKEHTQLELSAQMDSLPVQEVLRHADIAVFDSTGVVSDVVLQVALVAVLAGVAPWAPLVMYLLHILATRVKLSLLVTSRARVSLTGNDQVMLMKNLLHAVSWFAVVVVPVMFATGSGNLEAFVTCSDETEGLLWDASNIEGQCIIWEHKLVAIIVGIFGGALVKMAVAMSFTSVPRAVKKATQADQLLTKQQRNKLEEKQNRRRQQASRAGRRLSQLELEFDPEELDLVQLPAAVSAEETMEQADTIWTRGSLDYAESPRAGAASTVLAAFNRFEPGESSPPPAVSHNAVSNSAIQRNNSPQKYPSPERPPRTQPTSQSRATPSPKKRHFRRRSGGTSGLDSNQLLDRGIMFSSGGKPTPKSGSSHRGVTEGDEGDDGDVSSPEPQSRKPREHTRSRQQQQGMSTKTRSKSRPKADPSQHSRSQYDWRDNDGANRSLQARIQFDFETDSDSDAQPLIGSADPYAEF